MKILKAYEIFVDSYNMEENSELLKKYSFKIGDHVRLIQSDVKKYDIVEIIAINTEDSFQPYQVSDGLGKYWMSGAIFELVPDYEVKGIKYNI